MIPNYSSCSSDIDFLMGYQPTCELDVATVQDKLDHVSGWLASMELIRDSAHLANLHRLQTNLRSWKLRDFSDDQAAIIMRIQEACSHHLAKASPKLPGDLFKEISQELVRTNDFKTIGKLLLSHNPVYSSILRVIEEEMVDLWRLGCQNFPKAIEFCKQKGIKTLTFSKIGVTHEQLAELPRIFPQIEKLIIKLLGGRSFSIQKEKAFLESLPTLKFYGNLSKSFKDFSEALEYVKLFSQNRELQSYPRLCGLSLAGFDITDEQLEKLLTHAPYLEVLNIKSNVITKISAHASLKEINCSGCCNLKVLKAPVAKIVSCSGCIALEELAIPQVIELNCHTCQALRVIDSCSARVVCANSCDNLQRIEVPNAISISCVDCEKLCRLVIPSAVEVSCDLCPSLGQNNIQISY